MSTPTERRETPEQVSENAILKYRKLYPEDPLFLVVECRGPSLKDLFSAAIRAEREVQEDLVKALQGVIGLSEKRRDYLMELSAVSSSNEAASAFKKIAGDWHKAIEVARAALAKAGRG
jgi:hypothetical protein